jgi:hypothetical protein
MSRGDWVGAVLLLLSVILVLTLLEALWPLS